MELKQICAYMNALRERYGSNELIKEDLFKVLPSDLKNRIYELELAGVLMVRKEKTRKMYRFPKEPIHISKFDFLTKKVIKKNKQAKRLDEQQCITFLKGLGYKILKAKYVEV